MSTLDSLAPELIQRIVTELGNNVTDLRLVCKRMSSVLESHVLGSITIDITKLRLDVGISQLTTLATQGNHTATATHDLHIRNLCPLKDPFDRSPTWVLDPVTEKWGEKPPTPCPPEGKIAEEKMQAMLQVAIASLSNLRTLKYDSEWTPKAVMNAVKTLPLLESLELIVGSSNTADLQLQSLRNLQSLMISAPNNDYFMNIIEPISLLVAKSPNLHTLHVGPTYGPAASLHQLLRHCRPNLVLPLKHLGLQGVSVKLDSITLPHFRRLTSLTLHHYTTSESDSDRACVDKAESSRPDEIWAMLKTTDVRLTGIDVNQIPTSLLDYISSYSGLKKLRLARIDFETQEQSDLAAIQFYNTCLDKHTSSLEELVVKAEYEGGWCLGDEALVVISLCKKLKILEGCLVSAALADAVKSLIDLTTQLPRMEKLTVHPADLEAFRSYMCGYLSMAHSEDVTTRLSKCIGEYEVNEFSNPVPLILVDSKKFMMTPSEGAGGALRYRCDSMASPKKHRGVHGIMQTAVLDSTMFLQLLLDHDHVYPRFPSAGTYPANRCRAYSNRTFSDRLPLTLQSLDLMLAYHNSRRWRRRAITQRQTHDLHIRNLCPSKDPSEYRGTGRATARFIPSGSEDCRGKDAGHASGGHRLFKLALSNLRSLKWNIGEYDSKWTPTCRKNPGSLIRQITDGGRPGMEGRFSTLLRKTCTANFLRATK
ncbi:uncharacterized protein LACBIDRAFT_295928 [Laccaria bicolor S238N-H82]|uniref:Predicted protein n=1 Tax=Laccaria bicolor (strain S238N-H82 / ATCC MYA-4686) TaxID=486041 RepID=B0E0D8_LACBS|nr:uncharacterized protein LACBIDRAFT_295928 [Laccaria bicolor S238N-H82]EDQ99702.1 predicted protein [Laccaria bicolor S238N-H82]|eukprot:XP_001889679.1 predicted protein [Laccaria bicolor S238N-H82]